MSSGPYFVIVSAVTPYMVYMALPYGTQTSRRQTLCINGRCREYGGLCAKSGDGSGPPALGPQLFILVSGMQSPHFSRKWRMLELITRAAYRA